MKKLILVSFGFLALISGCMEEHRAFTIVNNSSHSIGLYEADASTGATAYPDTSLPVNNKFVSYEIAKSGATIHVDGQTVWEDIFVRIPSDTLSIFIFHTDTLKKYSWQEVRDGYKVLKRYDLSLEDLKRMNYTITYP